MNIKVIACDVLNREISMISSQSEHFVDVTFLPQGLHNEPDLLRRTLQEQIDLANKGFHLRYLEKTSLDDFSLFDYDFIVLGYGLCSNGIAGLSSARIPLVIPRAHDCITILLGSKERYREYFDSHKGIYWYSAGWIERTLQPGEERYRRIYDHYVKKYGEDNANYLMEMEQAWFKSYHYAAYIDWGLPRSSFYRDYTKQCAKFLGWQYDELKGDRGLLENIINGRFLGNEVLLAPPGEEIHPSYDDMIICSQRKEAECPMKARHDCPKSAIPPDGPTGS